MKPDYSARSAELYADTANPVLPKVDMVLDLKRVALVVIDPQVDVMSPQGKAWPAVGESVTENNLVPNLIELFAAAKKAGVVVAVSPHYYYCWDHHWRWQAPLEKFQHDAGVFDRRGPYAVEGFRGSGADFLEAFKPYIEDGETIVCSPHKLYGPQANDLKLQLGKRGISQVILAGMLANMCVESHMRDLLEAGFEVAVVRDAVAAPKLPDGDGYLAALINYRYMANGVWSADETVRRLAGAS
ncbi:cysteine hydrolase family protein [Methylocella sp.]|uniref:cysteine hydrolase family protein n=1 Tax=Methylocella sp. TaxID=1978226 RepID=UPI003782D9E2